MSQKTSSVRRQSTSSVRRQSTSSVRRQSTAGQSTSSRQAGQAVDPNMRHLGIGIDTARYGHHVTFLREDKELACPALPIMESRAGYQQLQQRFEQLHVRFPNARLHLRIDAAGQYAANLELFVRSLDHLPLTVSVGEPKRNKDYHRAHSPKRKSDASESHAMARYAVVERPEASHGKPAEFAVLRQVASRLAAQIKQTTRLTNQLHAILANSFPELATLINDLTAGWVLQLLEKYPSAQKLAAARLGSIQKIPFLPAAQAEPLHRAAQTSVGTLAGDFAEALIKQLVGELRHALAQEKQWKTLLKQAFDALPDGPHKQIATINGSGDQTAAAIVATAVDVKRFETAGHLTGYYGIFPEEIQSGVDKFGRPIPAGKKIMCRKGNDLVRALLWQCAKCASAKNAGNPEVCTLYARRMAKGDSPQTAWGYCMNKLLHQVFGVWTSGKPYDPQHEQRRRAKRSEQEKSEHEKSEQKKSEHETEKYGFQKGSSQPPLQIGQGDSDQPESERETEASGQKVEPTREEPATEKLVTQTPAPFLEPVSSEPPAPFWEPVGPDATKPNAATKPTAATATSSRRPIHYAVLRERIPLQQVLEHIHRQPLPGTQHRGPCPIHEPTATTGRLFSANLKRQVFRGFHPTCQAQGNVLDFWQAYRHFDDLYDAALDLAKTFGIEVPFLDHPTPQTQTHKYKKTAGITRQALDYHRDIGNAHLKWAFSEAAVIMLRELAGVKGFVARLEKKHGKSKAISILAARIGRTVYWMLKRKESFDEARFLK